MYYASREVIPGQPEFDEAHMADLGLLRVVNGLLYQLLQDIYGNEYWVAVEEYLVDESEIITE